MDSHLHDVEQPEEHPESSYELVPEFRSPFTLGWRLGPQDIATYR